MSILQILSTVCFVLAPCLLVASIIIFVKMHVMDAIRFLQHKPTSRRLSGEGSTTRNKGRASRSLRKQRAADKAAKTGPTGDVEHGSAEKKGSAPVPSPSKKSKSKAKKARGSSGTVVIDAAGASPKEASELDTDLLVEEASELDTDVLAEEASEYATDVLVEEESERGTDVLVTEASEAATDVLADTSEADTDVLAESGAEASVEPSERETGVLVEEESESATTVLVTELQEQDSFMFKLKQEIVMVHTDERVG